MRQSTGTKLQKSYEEPALEKLTPEQAKKFLLNHANKGDQGAKDILELVLPTRKDSK
jgi:hypothetical protein